MNDILETLLVIYAATVVFALILLFYILYVEIKEGKVPLRNTLKEFFFAFIMAFIPIVNLSIIKNSIKAI